MSATPREFNYLLQFDNFNQLPAESLFIPLSAIRLASDKRLLAKCFSEYSIPTPETHLIESTEEIERLITDRKDKEWCLKYPTSSGANGHRLLRTALDIPANWPTPFVVQEFIRLERPEVYRTFCAHRQILGWAIRRFPEGTPTSPWVAHARGARYQCEPDIPEAVAAIARATFQAVGIFDSFGCVDLIRKESGEWLVLEVGTDGIFNHVDRDLGDISFAAELQQHTCDAFWRSAHSRFSAAAIRSCG